MQSREILDKLLEFLSSLLQFQDRILLYPGMWIDSFSYGSCLVQLDFSGSFLILSKESIHKLGLKLEEYDESRSVEKSNDLDDSDIVKYFYFDKELSRKLIDSLKWNIKFTENHRQFGVNGNVIFVDF